MACDECANMSNEVKRCRYTQDNTDNHMDALILLRYQLVRYQKLPERGELFFTVWRTAGVDDTGWLAARMRNYDSVFLKDSKYQQKKLLC